MVGGTVERKRKLKTNIYIISTFLTSSIGHHLGNIPSRVLKTLSSVKRIEGHLTPVAHVLFWTHYHPKKKKARRGLMEDPQLPDCYAMRGGEAREMNQYDTKAASQEVIRCSACNIWFSSPRSWLKL